MSEQAGKIILGIETSCDETAAAIIMHHSLGNATILSNIVRTQIDEHAAYGGVVPELAARSHIIHLEHIVATALSKARIELKNIDIIAATAGPGLVGGLLVGLTFAKGLAAANNKPFIAINHLEAHALSARLVDKVSFPYLMLLVSGGHTQFLLVKNVGDYQRLGTTIDDALGEGFDKVAKMLSLGLPGGPMVEKMALRGNAKRFKFPRPLLHEKRLDFSFSGLKTAVRLKAEKIAPLSEQDICDICASFQQAVVDILTARTKDAIDKFNKIIPNINCQLVVAGGVAANKQISKALKEVAKEKEAKLIVPPMALCTDNGAMIAFAGGERAIFGISNGFDVAAKPRWPLTSADMRIDCNEH